MGEIYNGPCDNIRCVLGRDHVGACMVDKEIPAKAPLPPKEFLEEMNKTTLKLLENFKEEAKANFKPPQVRKPVEFLYNALNWDFIHGMARIAAHAQDKYGEALQYAFPGVPPLVGDGDPMNHIPNHLRFYHNGQLHDYTNDRAGHLFAIAYNAMMEYYFLMTFDRPASILSAKDGQMED